MAKTIQSQSPRYFTATNRLSWRWVFTFFWALESRKKYRTYQIIPKSIISKHPTTDHIPLVNVAINAT